MTTGTRRKRAPLRSVGPATRLPPGTFGGWLRPFRTRARVALGTLYAIPIATLLGSFFQHQATRLSVLSIDHLRFILYGIQAIVVLILSFTIPRARPEEEVLARLPANRIDMARVGERARAFASLWSNAWFCWFLLYACLAILGVYGLLRGGDPWFGAPIQNLLNNVQTVFFLLCFRELSVPTHGTPNPQFRWIAIAVTIAAIEALLLSAPSAVGGTWGKNFSQAVGWCTGFAAGTAIALLVGRLESKLINVNPLLPGALYLYAAIQGAFAVFPENPELALVLTSVAFVLKMVFYTFIAWLLGSGLLSFYLSMMQDMDLDVPGKREAFFTAVRGAEK